VTTDRDDVREGDDDVLAALRAAPPAGPPPGLRERVRPRAEAALAAPADPRRWAFEEHAPTVHGYLLALVPGDGWLAEQATGAAFAELAPDADPGLAELLLAARQAAQAQLAKGGAPSGGAGLAGLAFDERALLLERRLGLGLEALARTWSAVPARLEERLREAGRALVRRLDPADGLEAGAAAAEAALLDGVDHQRDPLAAEARLVDAALDLLPDPAARAHAEHLAACAYCAALTEALEDALTAQPTDLPDAERTWKGVVAAAEPPGRSAEELGIAVAVSCCYCHDRLSRARAAFCATCLAPHHPDCFAAHGGCSAPGCPGAELVRPGGPANGGGRQGAGGWQRGLAAVGAAAILGGVAAAAAAWGASATAPRDLAPSSPRPAEPSATGEAADEAGPAALPPDVRLGCRQAALVEALGEPSSTEVSERGRRLVWLGAGVHADLDPHDRLVRASFFGHRWSWRGVQVGAPSSEALTRLGPADRTIVAADGGPFHVYEAEGGVVLQASAAPEAKVRAIHLASGVASDGAGSVSLARADFTERHPGRVALGRLLTAARAEGVLEYVFGEQHFLRYDGQGRSAAAIRVAVRRSEGALELTAEQVGLDASLGASRLAERYRLALDGRLLEVERSRRWTELTADGAESFSERTAGAVADAGRLVLAVEEPGEPASERVVLPEDGHLPRTVARWLVPGLASLVGDHLGQSWQIDAEDPLETTDAGYVVECDGRWEAWEGRNVLCVRVDGLGDVRVDEGEVRVVESGSGWIEPIPAERFADLVAETAAGVSREELGVTVTESVEEGSRAGAPEGDPEARAELARLDAALEEGPTAEGYRERAAVREDLGELDGALVDLTRAIERDPEHAEAYLARARIRARLDRPQDAPNDDLSVFTRKAETDADRELGARLFALAFHRTGDVSEALEALDDPVVVRLGVGAGALLTVEGVGGERFELGVERTEDLADHPFWPDLLEAVEAVADLRRAPVAYRVEAAPGVPAGWVELVVERLAAHGIEDVELAAPGGE